MSDVSTVVQQRIQAKLKAIFSGGIFRGLLVCLVV